MNSNKKRKKKLHLKVQSTPVIAVTLACVASVSSGREANSFCGRARIGRAQKKKKKKKKFGGGRGGEEKETLADKPLDFENSCSPTNGVSDWCGLEFLIDTS